MSRTQLSVPRRGAKAAMIVQCMLLFILFSCPAVRVKAIGLSVREGPSAVPFYLYDGDEYPSLQPLSTLMSETEIKEQCSEAHEGLVVAYWVTNVQWLYALRNHPWRRMDPEDAELFVILYSVDESIGAGTCRGESHYDRTSKAVQTVISSPWYQRNHGRDHFWPMSDWKLQGDYFESYPKSLREVIRNMTVGRYIDGHQNVQDVSYWVDDTNVPVPWWRQRCKWRCTLLTPVKAGQQLFKDELSYEEWNARGTFLFFRGKWRDCHDPSAALSRSKVFELNILPNVSISKGHAKSSEVRGLT
ncbi:unnamed protein product [Choristocarpus tenellus]